MALVVFGVNVGPLLEQDLGGRKRIHHCRSVQRRTARVGFGVEVGPLLEQDLGGRKRIRPCRKVQRRTARRCFWR